MIYENSFRNHKVKFLDDWKTGCLDGEALRAAVLTCRPIRILRRVVVSILIFYTPSVFVVMVLGYRYTKSDVLGFGFAGIEMGFLIAAFLALAWWPCPQCGKRFAGYNAFWP